MPVDRVKCVECGVNLLTAPPFASRRDIFCETCVRAVLKKLGTAYAVKYFYRDRVITEVQYDGRYRKFHSYPEAAMEDELASSTGEGYHFYGDDEDEDN